jgi:hypothetical protein
VKRSTRREDPVISSSAFTQSARDSFLATELSKSIRDRFEAVAVWQIKQGVADGEKQLIVIGFEAIEFTYGRAGAKSRITKVDCGKGFLGRSHEGHQSKRN